MAGLQNSLNAILARYTPQERLQHDPLQFPHRYSNKADIEITAFLSALYAFGNVSQILSTIEKILKILGPKPYEFISNFNFNKDSHKFSSIIHRWIRGEDLGALLYLLQQVILKHGSLYNIFLAEYAPNHITIRPALLALNKQLLNFPPPHPTAHNTKGFRFFFADPGNGSPCKRWNLFLRWMVRREEGLDLGLWKDISPSKLIIPLDTHIARIGRHLKLTNKTTPSWEMAEDITKYLAKLDPNDPVKYDFALCHFGISGDFSKNENLQLLHV